MTIITLITFIAWAWLVSSVAAMTCLLAVFFIDRNRVGWRWPDLRNFWFLPAVSLVSTAWIIWRASL